MYIGTQTKRQANKTSDYITLNYITVYCSSCTLRNYIALL